jgi:DHA1 family tetracycline resistance protein-like MFS transporter
MTFPSLWARATLVRTLPRPAQVGIVLFFLAGLADGVLMPFFALWAQREAGVPTAYIGLLLGCYAGGELLATPLVGGIADRIGRRPVLLISTAGIGGGFLLLHQVHGTVLAGLALLLIGAFESVLHPTAATVIADVAPSGSLRQHYALTRMASGAGHVAGPALGAVLAGWSLGLVFVGSAVAMLAGTVMVAALLPETRAPGAAAGDDDDDDVTALLAVLRDTRLAALLAPLAALGLASSWIEAVLPLYAAGAGTLTASGVGLLFTWAGIVSVVFQLPVAAWSGKMTGFSVAGSSGILLALAFGGLLASSALPVLVMAVTLVSFAEMLAGPLAQAIVAELAPQAARATYMAAFSVVQDLRDAAGPAIGTALFAAAARLPWLVGVPVVLVASLTLALAARRHEASSGEQVVLDGAAGESLLSTTTQKG